MIGTDLEDADVVGALRPVPIAIQAVAGKVVQTGCRTPTHRQAILIGRQGQGCGVHFQAGDAAADGKIVPVAGGQGEHHVVAVAPHAVDGPAEFVAGRFVRVDGIQFFVEAQLEGGRQAVGKTAVFDHRRDGRHHPWWRRIVAVAAEFVRPMST